jgi:hypothetical protein
MIDLHDARQLFPDLERQTYLETAAVSLGSTRLHDATCVFMDRWTADGVDFMQAQTAAERAHGLFTARVGVARRNVARVPAGRAAGRDSRDRRSGIELHQFSVAAVGAPWLSDPAGSFPRRRDGGRQG